MSYNCYVWEDRLLYMYVLARTGGSKWSISLNLVMAWTSILEFIDVNNSRIILLQVCHLGENREKFSRIILLGSGLSTVLYCLWVDRWWYSVQWREESQSSLWTGLDSWWEWLECPERERERARGGERVSDREREGESQRSSTITMKKNKQIYVCVASEFKYLQI